MILLTSYNRMLRYLGNAAGTALSDTRAQRQQVMRWITTASKQIETYLKRTLQIGSYTEYFNSMSEQYIQFHVSAYPILSLGNVFSCYDGLWNGNETEIDDCFINTESTGVVMPQTPDTLGYKTFRVCYTGGLAYDGVYSTFTLTASLGTWSSSQFVYGGTSEAVGVVKSLSGSSLIVENLYGIFSAGESLTEYTDENITTIGDASAILLTIDKQSLVEQYPDIVTACEIQVRYYWKHKDDFELDSTSKDGTNRRTFGEKNRYLVEPAAQLLEPYVKKFL